MLLVQQRSKYDIALSVSQIYRSSKCELAQKQQPQGLVDARYSPRMTDALLSVPEVLT